MKELLLSHKKQFTLYIIACCFPVIERLMGNIGFALLIGSVERGEWAYFLKLVALVVFLSVFGAGMFLVSRFMRIKFMRDIVLEIRIRAFEKIMKLSYGAFSQQPKERYLSNLINDINLFEQTFFHRLINVIFQGGTYVVSLILLLFFDWKFALGILALSLGMFYLLNLFQKQTVTLQKEVSDQQAALTSELSNTMNGLEILKLNGIEEQFLKKNLEEIDRVEKKKFQYTVFTGQQRGLTQLLGYAAFIGILVYLLSQGIKGMPFVRIALMVQLGNGCIWPISQMLPFLNELKGAAAIYDRITKQEDGAAAEPDLQGDKPFSFERCVKVQNLSFGYEGREILQNASFTLEKGKKYLLKGASGAGKSTLIKLLSKTYPRYEGTISFDGTELKELDENGFNQQIAFIYQDVFLFEETVYNNIALFKELSDEAVKQAAQRAGLTDFLQERTLGLQEKVTENGKNLSGGQRQRISIARAIAKNAALLFVDEGTSSLNEELGRSVEETILSLDSTVIAISHRYYEGITEKYDYVLELKNGTIVQHDARLYFEGGLAG